VQPWSFEGGNKWCVCKHLQNGPRCWCTVFFGWSSGPCLMCCWPSWKGIHCLAPAKLQPVMPIDLAHFIKSIAFKTEKLPAHSPSRCRAPISQFWPRAGWMPLGFCKWVVLQLAYKTPSIQKHWRSPSKKKFHFVHNWQGYNAC